MAVHTRRVFNSTFADSGLGLVFRYFVCGGDLEQTSSLGLAGPFLWFLFC
jgi:hypothetical protein